MIALFMFYGVEFSIATIITIFAISAMFGGIVYFLAKKQAKFADTLKPGDKVYFGEHIAEIVEKGEGNKWLIKTEVSGMRLGEIKKIKNPS